MPVCALALAATSTSCVEAFTGSFIEIVMAPSTHVPGQGNPEARPPEGTHYELWVTSGGGATRVFQFRIVNQVDLDFPCFVEDVEAKYPGLHSSSIFERVRDDELANPQGDNPNVNEGLSQAQVDRITDAQQREIRANQVAGGVKALVGYDPNTLPADLAELEMRVAMEAPIDRIDDESNARRTEICEQFFDEHPRFYVGFDSVFSLPLNGDWYGVVTGLDPRTGAPLGGAGFTVPYALEDFDQLQVRWNYDDPAMSVSTNGTFYVGGPPIHRTRRTINVSMTNESFSALGGDIAIFPSLGEDDVVF
jgi:hypothetical protein